MRGATLAAAQKLTEHIDLKVKETDPSLEPRDLALLTNQALEELASKLKGFVALRTLVIRSEWMWGIRTQTFSNFTTLHQLTSLEVDLRNIMFEPGPTPHLCESLSQLIPHLQRLRCRLFRICNDLLGSPPGDLEELIINISPTEEGGLYCSPCSGSLLRASNDANLQASMETGLLQFAASMHDPKVVRLIHHIQRGDRKTYAFDAIENRRLCLGGSTAWDADGVLLPEDWEENEESEEENEEGEEENEESEENEEFPDDEESDEDEEFFEEEESDEE